MKVLLTGGAGYIGSACLRWLLWQGVDAYAFDNLSEGNAAAVPDGRLIVGDILDRAALARALRGHKIDAVMHFAAVASVPDSIADPDTYYRVNVEGTKAVLDAMRDAGVGQIVFSSTAATYGLTGDMPLREDSPQAPAVPYGTTKLAAEWLIKDYSRAYGLGYALMRYFNASGADGDGRHGEARRHESHLIPLALAATLGQRPPLKVFGGDLPTRDGSCVRDFVHVEDIAQAHLLALQALRPGTGEAYNIGSGRGVTVREVLRACEVVTGRPVPHEVVGPRPGDPAVLIASPEKLVRQLGWKPRHAGIHAIVETAWRWHRGHPHGYAPAGGATPPGRAARIPPATKPRRRRAATV